MIPVKSCLSGAHECQRPMAGLLPPSLEDIASRSLSLFGRHIVPQLVSSFRPKGHDTLLLGIFFKLYTEHALPLNLFDMCTFFIALDCSLEASMFCHMLVTDFECVITSWSHLVDHQSKIAWPHAQVKGRLVSLSLVGSKVKLWSSLQAKVDLPERVYGFSGNSIKAVYYLPQTPSVKVPTHIRSVSGTAQVALHFRVL